MQVGAVVLRSGADNYSVVDGILTVKSVGTHDISDRWNFEHTFLYEVAIRESDIANRIQVTFE